MGCSRDLCPVPHLLLATAAEAVGQGGSWCPPRDHSPGPTFPSNSVHARNKNLPGQLPNCCKYLQSWKNESMEKTGKTLHGQYQPN